MWRRLNVFRVFILVNFFKRYSRTMAAKRKGECKMCGSCCRDCCYKTPENKCGVWTDRPDWCRHGFPLDPADLKAARLDGICGYHWD